MMAPAVAELEAAPPAQIVDADFALAPARCAFCRRSEAEVLRLVLYRAAAICSECLGDALAVLRATVALMPRCATSPREQPVNPALKLHEPVQFDASISERRAPGGGGFTGDACDVCGNFRLVRTGTCTTCLDCGSTGGCG